MIIIKVTNYMSTNTSEYMRMYRRKNIERIKVSRKHYKKSAKGKATMKKWRDGNKEKIRKWKRDSKSERQRWFERITQRDGEKCIGCGSTERLTLNHKFPRCIGGKYSFENLEIMCLFCNVKNYHELVRKALTSYFKNASEITKVA